MITATRFAAQVKRDVVVATPPRTDRHRLTAAGYRRHGTTTFGGGRAVS